MRTILLLFLLFAPLHVCANTQKTAHVTYTKSGGRFGDNLIAYMHAKFFSYKYNIPLLYDPFPYSDQLTLHLEEKRFTSKIKKQFQSIQDITLSDRATINSSSSTLYIVPYYPESLYEASVNKNWTYLPINWDDKGFKQILKRLIHPIAEPPKLNLPKDRITVAVHLRLREPLKDQKNPSFILKFPSHDYYIAQIKRMSKLWQDQPLYVYLFTDHPNPTELLHSYKKWVNAPNIEFDCRTGSQGANTNVLEDFFALTQFDCLIRPDSNFSIAAEKIADFKIVIYPMSPLQGSDTNTIEMVGIKWHEDIES